MFVKMKKIVLGLSICALTATSAMTLAANNKTTNAMSSELSVHFLGTGSPIPLTSRFGPSILVQAGDDYLLFDGGRGAIQRIYSLGIPFPKIDKLFVTHLHSDHTVGIPDVFLTSWLRGRKTPFEVWGPEGTSHLMNGIRSTFEYDIKIRLDQNEGSNVVAHDITEGIVYDKAGVKVTAFEVDHGPVKPALGYRVDYQGKSVLLSGDTRYNDNLMKYAKDVDVLVHEVAAASTAMATKAPVTQKIVDIHTTPTEAGQLFAQVKPKLAVYSHIVLFDVDENELIEQTRTHYQGPLVVANDLMSIQIGKEGYSVKQTSAYKD